MTSSMLTALIDKAITLSLRRFKLQPERHQNAIWIDLEQEAGVRRMTKQRRQALLDAASVRNVQIIFNDLMPAAFAVVVNKVRVVPSHKDAQAGLVV